MGAIQSAVDKSKQRIGNERMAESGIDPDLYVREDRKIPDFEHGGIATLFFQRVPESYIMKHANDKFRIAGRDRKSYLERIDLPAYSPDSVRALQSGEAWQRAKELLKALSKGDTDKLADMADQATKRGGVVIQKRNMGGQVYEEEFNRDELLNRTALPVNRPFNNKKRWDSERRF
jgi:hypothetical protein